MKTKMLSKKLENGKFTTIHNSILFDTRLTPTAFRLMTAILSDSDTQFNLSQTLYCKRLGIANKPSSMQLLILKLWLFGERH